MTKHIIFSYFRSVQASLWPLLLSLSLFSTLGNTVLYFSKEISLNLCLFSGFLTFSVILLWWKDVLRESHLGMHTHKLEISLRCGIALFILSEVFFFLRFFWAYFDASLAPRVELGMNWPPMGITPLSIYRVPLLNTLILLTRGISVTWAHHSLIGNRFIRSFWGLFITIILGIYFLYLQRLEYFEAPFSIRDGIYGRTFFITTGFHGFHVFVGTSFLFYVFISLILGNLTSTHHFSFEAAAWYWHFVDVVWLGLYLSIYWWGSM